MSDKKQRSYTAQYRADAVVLAKEIGSSEAARQLNIPADTLYTWISRAKNGSLPKSPHDPEPKASLKLAERLKILEQEISMLKSENTQLIKEKKILEEATIFFAARQKK